VNVILICYRLSQIFELFHIFEGFLMSVNYGFILYFGDETLTYT